MSESDQLHPDLEALVGTTLHDRYRVDSLLGVGGMGAVFKARHTGLDRDVAIKVLHPEIGRDASVSKRFDREATSASRLDHPNCVRVTDFGSTDAGTKYLVMELLAGTELEARLGRVWAPAAMIETAKQILAGLEHAHHFGIVHRDLKPENVFITTDFRGEELVKLVDFGIAKLLDERGTEKLTRQGIVFGTPRYMSPEQAAGGKVDARTDLYAAGLIFYEMLAGHPPFIADDLAQLLRMQIMATPPPLPEAVPRPLASVVEKLLEKSKTDRFSSAREVIDALEAAASSIVGASADHAPIEAAQVDVAPAGPAEEVARTISIPVADHASTDPATHSGAAWQPAAAPVPAPARSGATIVSPASLGATNGPRRIAARTGSHAGIGQPATGAFESLAAGVGPRIGTDLSDNSGSRATWTGSQPAIPLATPSPNADVSTSVSAVPERPVPDQRERAGLRLALAGAALLLAFVALGFGVSLLVSDERAGGGGDPIDTNHEPAVVAATGEAPTLLDAEPDELPSASDALAPGPTRAPTIPSDQTAPRTPPVRKVDDAPTPANEKPTPGDSKTKPAEEKNTPVDTKPKPDSGEPADSTTPTTDVDEVPTADRDRKPAESDAAEAKRREHEAAKQGKGKGKGK